MFVLGINIAMRAAYIAVALFVSTYLLLMIKKYHNYEYKIHRFYIMTFMALIICVSTFQLYNDYKAYVERILDDKEKHKWYKYTHAQICFQVLAPAVFLMPLMIVTFKKNEDLFTCFSKIDNLARVSTFQRKTVFNSSIWGSKFHKPSVTSSVTQGSMDESTFQQMLDDQVNNHINKTAIKNNYSLNSDDTEIEVEVESRSSMFKTQSSNGSTLVYNKFSK